ncbi:MAG: FG-GAP repeat protein [Proteobacteria bacterium]|nr:FG-GAP repeat protein [Pseudomonadota bacterium]
MTTFKPFRYARACMALAAASLLAASLSGCGGALKFDGGGDDAVPIVMTLGQDAERGCWVATFAVKNAGDALPEIDQASVADAVSISDAGGDELSATIWWDGAGSQATICAPLAWCSEYEIGFAEGVIADSEGDAFEDITLPTANKVIETPDNPGDYDGDCFADFLVGDYSANTNDGLARLYYGDADPAAGLAYAENAPAVADARFGNMVVVTDSTGVTFGGGIDLLIGARTTVDPITGIPNVGMVHLNDVVGANLVDVLNVKGNVLDERLGFRLGYLGDINGDGYGDFAAAGRGSPAPPPDPVESQEPYVFLGPWVADKTAAAANGKLKNDFDPANSNASFWIAGNHDFDGDGIDDAFVSGVSVDPADITVSFWKLYFYRGGQAFTGDVAPTSYLWGGGTNYNFFGYIFDLGDFNGDGNADLIAAAVDSKITSLAPLEITVDYGAAFIFFGPRSMDSPLTYEDADVMIGADDEIMGFHAANAGDMNGDGIEDVILTSLIEPNVPGYPDSKAYVYLGRESWVANYGKGDADLVISGLSGLTETIDDTIYAGAGMGDIDNDGLDDFALGAVEKASGRASIYVFKGQADCSGQEIYLSNAAQRIDSPDLVSVRGMTAAGGIWGLFTECQYPLDDYNPDPTPPPRVPGT